MANKAAEAVPLLDAADIEEIERDLRRRHSVAGAVICNPAVQAAEKREPKKRIPIPADDVRPPQLHAGETSWVTMLYPANLDALVDDAFTPERLARVPVADPDEGDDDDIDVDIELDEVPDVERQAATSGEIAVPDPPKIAQAPAAPSVDVAIPSTTPPPPSQAASPPPVRKEASGPPPVPLSVFTGEAEKVDAPKVEAADDAESATAPPPVPDGVIEEVSETQADEAAFETEDSTSVDEMEPLAFPDEGTPPPIPVEGEAPQKAPPQIPSDSTGTAPPVPAAAPPAVPASPAPPPKKKRPKKFKKPWFEEFFDDDYLRTIPFMTPTYTVKEMGYIRNHLDLPAGAKLLDVGCGYGRLAIEFARVGYEVTGLDTSLPLMFKAAEASTEAGVEVNFMHQDMREMSFDNEFDGVYCVMTSFGYFDDDTNRDVVGRMFRALKPGGKLFIEVINRDFILNDLPSRVWWEGDDCVVMDEVEFNFLTSRIVSKRSVVFSDGRSVNHDLSIRAYCLHELGRILHNAGFRVSTVTGNINTDNRFFGQHSPYLIVLSEKI